MNTLLIITGFALYFGLLGTGAWVVIRLNLQVRRLRDSPTPKESLHVLADLLEAQDLQISSCIRSATRNEGAIDDLLVRVKSIQARTNATERKNEQFDTVALADYIRQQQDLEAVAPQQAPENIDQASGQEIDYR